MSKSIYVVRMVFYASLCCCVYCLMVFAVTEGFSAFFLVERRLIFRSAPKSRIRRLNFGFSTFFYFIWNFDIIFR